MGGVHHFHKLGVDPLREVRVVFKGRADLFQLQAVYLRHHGHAVGIAHADAGHLPAFALHFQRAVHQRALAHVHGRQGRGHGGVLAHFHLPQPRSHPGHRLAAGTGINGQPRLCHSVGVQPLGHTADAVAAHLCLAAVRVKNAHPAIGPGGNGGTDADDAIGSHGKMPPGQVPRQRDDVLRHAAFPAVQIDVIVGTALHFGKG